MNVHTYSWVKDLKEKHKEGREISISEIRKLEKYVRQKEKVADLPDGDWSKVQFLKAKRLLKRLRKENDMVLEAEA